MLQSLSRFSVLVLVGGVFAASAHGGVIDLNRTHNGGPTPFTTLTDDVPTPWEVYLPPAVTYPTAQRRWWFAEASYNNHEHPSFGVVQVDGERRTGRPYWNIWNQLAAVPEPRVLWLAGDNGVGGGGPEQPPLGFDRFEEVGGVIPAAFPASTTLLHGDRLDLTFVPEPTSLGLWLTAMVMLLLRRRRPQPVMATVHA